MESNICDQRPECSDLLDLKEEWNLNFFSIATNLYDYEMINKLTNNDTSLAIYVKYHLKLNNDINQ